METPALAPFVRHYDPEVYVADYKDNKKCAISFTFDDGLSGQYTVLFPETGKIGFKGTFWVLHRRLQWL